MLHDKPTITAVLGPTNTGKTHLALDRMLGHASGVIGFPLRLLARENYDRIVRLKGAAHVALITGEERILPAHPRWYVCTVESMPVDLRPAFLAIDEIQLAADPDRGHVFTDRLLHARGTQETMFLGSETIRPLLRRLVPGAEIITRPRFSRLTYAGSHKLTRLPRRCAVVAFSAADVYSIAELIRRSKGGTAVVMGALSPRTRNAQVAMFQAGEVDHLVATDAIGMGLNMDIDHVAFAALHKFDGRAPRPLTASETAQIAGRAGRHMNDGTFGTSSDAGLLDPETIERVETHTFPPLLGLFWRNPDLRFTSVEALRASLMRPPPTPGLIRIRPADDHLVLEALTREEDIARLATQPERLRLLWQVCQVPDFRKVMPETHARLLAQVYRHLTGPGERLPTDWVAGHLATLDRQEGDIQTLMDRIASIRVWTYLSHRADWLEDALYWQERTREIENSLSDVLHQRLTQRFVDLRTSVLTKRLRQGGPMLAAVCGDDRVSVEGHHLGRLEGLTFIADAGDTSSASRAANRAVANAAGRALRGEIARRVKALCAAEDHAFALSPSHRLLWRGAEVGRMEAGATPLRPTAFVPDDDLLDGEARERVRRRLARWVEDHIAATLPPLIPPSGLALSGAARGLLYQLAEALGSLPLTPPVREQVTALTKADRTALTRLGLRFGTESLFVPALLKPLPQRLRGHLWALWNGLPAVPPLPGGRVSLPLAEGVDPAFYAACGYGVFGPLAVRGDMVERLAADLRRLLREQTEKTALCPVPAAVLSPLGLKRAEAVPLLAALGYRAVLGEDGGLSVTSRKKPAAVAQRRKAQRPPRPANGDSPFAALSVLQRGAG